MIVHLSVKSNIITKWSPVPPKYCSKDNYLCNVCFLEFMCNQALFLDWVLGELCLVFGSATDFLHDLGQIVFFLSTICSNNTFSSHSKFVLSMKIMSFLE